MSNENYFSIKYWKLDIRYSIFLFLASVVIIISCEPLVADKSGKVVKVKDGDSIVLLNSDNKQLEMRLAHIDAPEYSQPFGRKSREFLADMIAGETISYRIYEDRDRYGRVIAEVFVSDSINVNKEMVRNGYAWHFKRYSSNFQYSRMERTARRNQAGLWVEPDPIAPWEWRDN